jgi:Tol biopolymer transport system component
VIFASLWARKGLWTIDVATGDLQPVDTGSVPYQGFPFFAPDGIYFAGPSRLGGFSIYRVSARGGEPVEMHEGSEGLPLQITVSRDGRRILYSRSWSISQLWQTGTEASPAKALYRDMVVRARLPVFSPDGKRLSYLVLREGTRNELWTMNADGSAAASVATDPNPQGIPLWNAPGTAVLYNARDRRITRLMRVNPADASKRLLLETGDDLQQAHITADEQAVIYDTGKPVNIWTRQLAGGAPRQLTFDSEGASFPSPSWDGKWIAYELQRGNATQIGLMDREGGHQKVLTEDPGLNWSNSWSSDNRRIAFAAFRDGVWNVCWIDRLTGERKQVTHRTAFGEFVRNPAWRPGSEQIVYEHWLVKGNLYMVEPPAAAR